MERLLDKAARATGLDPVRDPAAQLHPAGRDAASHRGRRGVRPGRVREDHGPGARARRLGRLRRAAARTRRGAASCAAAASRPTSSGPARCRPRPSTSRSAPTGTVTVFSGTQAMGQGLETTYVQLVAEVLEIDGARHPHRPGRHRPANGVGSVGSRSAFIGGSAIVMAGHKVVDDGKEPRRPGARGGGGGRRVPGGEVQDRRHRPRDRSLRARRPAAGQAHPLLRDRESVRRRRGRTAPRSARWRSTRRPAWSRSSATRPSTTSAASSTAPSSTGQIHGGIAQGVGQALYEQVRSTTRRAASSSPAR